MNKQCILVQGFDASDDDIDENSEDDDDTEKVLQDYNQAFMMKISQCGKVKGHEMTFDYSFLAPPIIQKLELNNRVDHLDIEKQNNPTQKETTKNKSGIFSNLLGKKEK